MNSPPARRVSSAAQRNVVTARLASTFAHFIGLPPSRAMLSPNSSTRAASPREICISASARACVGSRRDSANVVTAARTASSTSASEGTPTSATTEPSYGLRTSVVLSPVRHSPAT